jgi:hypothetical protein
MDRRRLIEKTALEMAQSILGSVKDALPVSEHGLAFEDFRTICKRNLMSYEFHAEQLRKAGRDGGLLRMDF